MILYIPVEVKNRELDAKILLASVAIERGIKVVIGKKNDLNNFIRFMPRGAYYGIGVFQNFKNFYSKLKKRKFSIFVCEEEGLITYKQDMYIDMRFSLETLKFVDRVYTWGQHNKNIISRKFPSSKSKFKVTGNPRFDILNNDLDDFYNEEILYIRNKYQKFFLVCTSFSSVNHFNLNINYINTLIEKKTIRNENSKKKFTEYQYLKYKTFNSYIELIEQIAKENQDISIVIRPHPSENLKVYKDLAINNENIFVETQFNVHPWIKESIGICHHYCTTSLEALSMDIPRFSFRPFKNTKCEYEFPFNCSYCFEDLNEFKNNINKFIKGSHYNKSRSKFKNYTKYAKNLYSSSSSKEIVDDIYLHLTKNNNNCKFFYANIIFSIIYYGFIKIKNLIFFRKNNSYLKHKFLKINEAEIKKSLMSFGVSNNVRITNIFNEIMILEKK